MLDLATHGATASQTVYNGKRIGVKASLAPTRRDWPRVDRWRQRGYVLGPGPRSSPPLQFTATVAGRSRPRTNRFVN